MLENYLGFITINWGTVIITSIIGMIVLNYATGILEEEISIIGKKLKILPSVRGAIFDASMSSLPEFFTALVGLFILGNKGLEVGTGTIGGSALFNILIIPAAVLLAYNWKKNIKIDTSSIKRDSVFYFLSIIILLIGLYFKQLILTSIVLIILYITYVFYLYKQSLKHRIENKKQIEKDYESVKNKKISYFKIFLGLLITYISVEAIVVAAKYIGEQIHISVFIVSLVILAAITSIPDTLLSIKASKRGDIDAGFSNAVGSNIFDICIGLGLPMFIGTVFMGLNPEINFKDNFSLFIFVIIATIIYFVILQMKNISKKAGYLLLFIYLLMIILLVIG